MSPTRSALHALALATALVSSTAEATTVITYNSGGVVEEFWVEIQSHEMRGEKIVVDGPCYSACTLTLMLAKKGLMCATPRAFFAFHRAYSGRKGTEGYEDDGGWTSAIMVNLPPKVAGWLEAKGGMTHDWKILGGGEMEQLVPMCPADAVAPSGEDHVLVPTKKSRG
jgi:hypothetical protein